LLQPSLHKSCRFLAQVSSLIARKNAAGRGWFCINKKSTRSSPMAMKSSSRWSVVRLTMASATTYDGRRNVRSTEHCAPWPRQSGALGGLMVGRFFLMGVKMWGTQNVFYVFPHRIFGEASFFLKRSLFYNEKSPWHARRMSRRTPKPWGTLVPSSSRNLHMLGADVLRCNQYKTVILE
jgi:hypothetical protein